MFNFTGKPLENWFCFPWAAEELCANVCPKTLISKAVYEWAEESWYKDEAKIIEEGNVLWLPLCVQHYECLCDGVGEGQHAQQQLKGMQQHCVHGFADGQSVLSQLPCFQ